jgi:hypothetical protein
MCDGFRFGHFTCKCNNVTAVCEDVSYSASKNGVMPRRLYENEYLPFFKYHLNINVTKSYKWNIVEFTTFQQTWFLEPENSQT